MNLFSVLPIRASPVFTVGASLWTEGTQPPARLLRESGGRQLAGCIVAAANANSGLDISVGATTVQDLLPSISSIITSIIPSSLLNIQVTRALSLYNVPSIGTPFSISTPPCPTPSPAPSPSPSASPSFGAIIRAAAPAGGEAPAATAAALSTDAIVSIAVGGAIVLVVLCAALICLPQLLRGAAVAKAFGAPGPEAVVGNPMHAAQQEEQVAHLREELAAALALMQQQQGAAHAGAQRALEAQQQMLAQQQQMQRQLQDMAAAAAAAATAAAASASAAAHAHTPSTHHHAAPHGSSSAIDVRYAAAPAAVAAVAVAAAAATPAAAAFNEAAVRRYAKEQFDDDELPPGFDWEADDQGKVLYTLPDGSKTAKDPRHNWASYLEAFMSKARADTAAGRKPKWAQ